MNIFHNTIQIINHNFDQIADCLLGATIAFLRGLYNERISLRKNFINALLCLLITMEVFNILVFMDVSRAWGSIVSLVIGLLGVNYFNRILTKVIERKVSNLIK